MLRLRNRTCKLCPLSEQAESICIGGDGPRNARILIIGEAPGQKEDEEDRPFVGESGQLLRRLVEAATNESVRYTNVVRCRPPDNRKPTMKERHACWRYLEAEIEAVKPWLVIAAGDTALRALTGHGGIVRSNGVPEKSLSGQLVLPVIHPAYVLRDPTKLPLLKSGLHTIGSLKTQPSPKSYTALITKEEIEAGLKTIHDDICGFDYETTGNDSFTCKITSVAISSASGQAFAFNPLLAREAFTRFLRETPLVAHNMAFEYIVSYRVFEAEPWIIWDTKLAQMYLHDDQPNDLKSMALAQTDLGPYQIEVHAKARNCGWDSLAFEDVWFYNCHDADATLRIYNQQVEKIDRATAERIMKQGLLVCRMRWEGMFVDQTALESAHDVNQKEMERVVEAIQRLPAVRVMATDLNPKSPVHVRKLLLGLGFPRLRGYTTPSGEMSVGVEYLERTKDLHPVVPLLLLFRKLEQERKSFLVPLGRLTNKTGYVHPSWTLGGTVSWRLSCSRPNLQNLPPSVKRLFVPSLGWFVQGDYSQLELRILAALSGERSMVEAFQEDQDIHARTAAQVFKKRISDITGEERAYGKRLNFATVYGIGPMGMQKKFGVPEKEAKELIERYWKTMPTVRQWLDDLIDQAREDGFVVSPFGKRRHLPDLLSKDREARQHAERQAGNFPIQSAGAEITLLAMQRIAASGLTIVAQVHDSILVDTGYPVQTRQSVKAEMEAVHADLAWMQSVPLKTEVTSGKNWQDMA